MTEETYKYPAVTKEIGDYLRRRCFYYVHVSFENDAEDILIELVDSLKHFGLLTPRFARGLYEERRKVMLKQMGAKNIAEDLREMCRDYVVAESDEHAGNIREELEETLKESDFYSEKLLGILEIRRIGVKGVVRDYLKSKNEDMKECCRRVLEMRLKDAKFKPHEIDAYLKELELERACLKK